MQPLVRCKVFCLAVAALVTSPNAFCVGEGCQGADETQLMQRLVRAKGGAAGKHRDLLSKLTDVTGVNVKSLAHAEELLRSLPKVSQIRYEASKLVVDSMIVEAEEDQKIIAGQVNNMSKFADCEGKLALSHAITDASVLSAKSEEFMSLAKKCQSEEKPCAVRSVEPRLRFRHEATDRGCKNWEENSNKRPDITTREDCEASCAKYSACKSYEWAEVAAFESKLCGLYMDKPCQVRSLSTSMESQNNGYNQYFKELVCPADTKLVGEQCLTCQIEAAQLAKRKDSCVALNQAAVDAATSAAVEDTKEAAGDVAKKATICARACEAEHTEPCEGVLAAAQRFTELANKDIQVSLEKLFRSAVDKSAAVEADRKKLRCETQLAALQQSNQDCIAMMAAKKSEADAMCKMYSKVLDDSPELVTSEGKKPCDETPEEKTRRVKALVEKGEEQLKELSEGKSSCENAKEELATMETTCKEKAELVEKRKLDCEQIVAETLKTNAGVQPPKPNHKPCAAYKQKKQACLDYNECYAVAKGINEYSFAMAKQNADANNQHYRQLKRLKCLLEADVSLDDCEKEAFHSDLSNLYPSEPPNKTACEENLQVCSTCGDMPHCQARGWRKHLGLNDTICPEAGCDDRTCCQPTCVVMASCRKPGFVKDPRMNERTCPEGGCDDDTCCKPTCASMTTCDTRGFIPDVTKSTKDCSAVTGCTDSQCCMATCASMTHCQTEGFVKDCQKKNRTCIPGVGCDDDTCCKATCASMKACKTPGLVKDKVMDLVDCPAGGCDDATCCLATCSTMETCHLPGYIVDKSISDTECGMHGCDHATCCKPTCASITDCSQRGFVRDPSKNRSMCAATGCDDATCCQPTCKTMTSCKKQGFVRDTRKDNTNCPEGGCDDDTCCEPTCESYPNCHALGWVKSMRTNSSLCRAGEKCDDATCCVPTCHSHKVCDDPHFVKDFTKGYMECPPGGCTDEACCKPTCGSMTTCVSPGFVKDAEKDAVICPPSGCNDDLCCMQTCATMDSCSTFGFVKDTRQDSKVCPKSGCDDQTCCKATCTSMSECTGRGHVRDAEMNSTDCPPDGCDDDTCCTATCTTMHTCARRGYVVADTDTVCPRTTGCTHEMCCKPTCGSMERCYKRGFVKDTAKDAALCFGGRCDDSFCCKPTCETIRSCIKPGYAKNLSAAGVGCPSTGCDDDTCCQPTCASMAESLTPGWVKDTELDAKSCPETGCDDASCSKPTCLSMKTCSAAGYIKDPKMDSMVCGPDGCDDDTCCQPTCASMQVCSLGFTKKPSSNGTLCGTQGCDDATCCLPTCASMQGCNSEDFYKLTEKDSKVCPASGCDDATCCKSMIQKTCDDGDYQDAALVMNCTGGNGTVHYKITDGVIKLIADLPKSAANVLLSTATESARYLDVKLVDPATGKCVVGYSGLGCTYSTEGDHDYENMTIYYTGDSVQDQHVKIKGLMTIPLQFYASPWSVITKNPTGAAGYSYDLIQDCPKKAPGCRSCSEHTGCEEGKTPICDGTYKVKCQ